MQGGEKGRGRWRTDEGRTFPISRRRWYRRALHPSNRAAPTLQQEVCPMSTLPTNIVRHGEPSRSALTVASLRAVHQLLDEPLVFLDPVALPLLGASAEAA